ncbi:MAG: CPBP family intramembrane metalloprotease [Lachnospiraceae bacterium]|nr:CPBP family intramembrane metalloprotease [Lachnospiraceae bacterium]
MKKIFHQNEEREEMDKREIVERKLFSFLRYFFPAIVPLLIYVGVLLLCFFVGDVILLGSMPINRFQKEFSNIFSVIGVIITFIILRKRSKKAGSTFFEDASLYKDRLNKKKLLLCAGFGMGAALFLSAIFSLLPSVGPIEEYKQLIDDIYHRWSVLLSMLFGIFFTPIVEEVVFRGYMLNTILPHWGEKASIFTVSLVFGIMHGSSLWILYAFAMGMALGKISIMEDNIAYSIIMHSSFNLPSAILWIIYLRYPGSQEALAQNKFLIVILGLAGGLMAYGCYLLYQKTRIKNKNVSQLFEE